MRIAIYSDEGTSRQGTSILARRFKELKTPFSFVTSKEIKEGKLSSFTTLVMPGGRDLPYQAHLEGKGVKEILRFMETGGSYLGICAGAYFACSELEFDLGFPLEVTGKRDLGFFPGKAIGPAYGKGTFCYDTSKGSRASKLRLPSNHSLFCFFKGGCIFENASEKKGIDFLAHYDDLEGKPPAIIACEVGKGIAILSGVHFEYKSSDLNPVENEEREIIPKIQGTEEQRANLFRSLLAKLMREPSSANKMKM
jgi:biotin--protein ligase